MNVNDYLLDQSAVDWPKALAPWSWLLPSELTLWLVNRFSDLFVVLEDGSIHMLDAGGGTFVKIAEDRNDFCVKIDEENRANEWLMIPLVDEMVAAGVTLRVGECYGFKLSPVLGGQYTRDNIAVFPVWDYLGANGSIHEQIREVPDGAKVILEVAN